MPANAAKPSYWLRSGFYTVSERVALQGFRFGGFLLLVRHFEDRADYGIWALFLLIAAVVEVGRMGLVQNALVRHLAGADPDKRGVINTASLALNLLTTAAIVVLLLALSRTYAVFWDAPPLRSMLEWYAVTTVVLVPFFQLNFVQQAMLDFRGIFLSNVAREGSFFAYVVVCAMSATGPNLVDLARFQIVAAAIGSTVAIVCGSRYLSLSASLDGRWLLRLFHFGKYVLGTNLGAMLIKSMDQFMLMALVPVAPGVAVALYNAANKIANLVEIPTQAVGEVVFPRSAAGMAAEGPPAVRRLYEQSVGFTLAVCLPGLIAVWWLAEPIVRLTAGARYLDAVPVLRVLMLYAMLLPVARQFGGAMDALGRPRVNFLCVAASAVLNLTLNVLLIGRYGPLGAAGASLITAVVVVTANLWILHRLLGVRARDVIVAVGGFYVQAAGRSAALLRRGLGTAATARRG